MLVWNYRKNCITNAMGPSNYGVTDYKHTLLGRLTLAPLGLESDLLSHSFLAMLTGPLSHTFSSAVFPSYS